jgi:hypothetical protein
MMIDENLARLRAHRNNVHRYRRLLATQLSDLERAYIERRLSEEEASMEALSPRRNTEQRAGSAGLQDTPGSRFETRAIGARQSSLSCQTSV